MLYVVNVVGSWLTERVHIVNHSHLSLFCRNVWARQKHRCHDMNWWTDDELRPQLVLVFHVELELELRFWILRLSSGLLFYLSLLKVVSIFIFLFFGDNNRKNTTHPLQKTQCMFMSKRNYSYCWQMTDEF